MKKLNFPIILIYIALLLYMIAYPSLVIVFGKYIRHLPVIGLGIIAAGCLIIKKVNGSRLHLKKNSIQGMVICTLIYAIIYYLSGVIFTFQYSGYSHEIITMIKNFYFGISVIFLQEYIRGVLVEYTKGSKVLYALIVVIFVALNVNIMSFRANFETGETAFKYVAGTLLPLVAYNMLFTYLAVNEGYMCNFVYRGVMEALSFITPIFPNLNWFLTALLGIITPSVIYFYFNFIRANTSERLSRRIIQKDNPMRTIPVYAILLLLAGFVYGLFSYAPVAVMSNSMFPQFTRGDVVIVHKVNEHERNNIQVGQIIEFDRDGTFILHRVIRVETDSNGLLKYYTKGDNNPSPDVGFVRPENVKGTIELVVPAIGYPSVVLSEVLHS